MISVYLIIAIVCAVLLAVTVALGGLIDHVDFGGHDFDIGGHDVDMGAIDAGGDYGEFHGPGISPLSLPIMLAFGTTFGGVGALLEQAGYNIYIVPMVSLVASALSAGALYFGVTSLFVKTQTTSTVDPRALVGRDAIVSIAIKRNMIGQVLVVTEERGRTLCPAVADEPVQTGTAVIIKEMSGGNMKVLRK